MSNQVYSNQTNKYYASQNPTLVGLSVNDTIPASPGNIQHTIAFNTLNYSGPSDDVSVNAGTITFLKDGIYSIQANINIQHPTNPSTRDLDLELFGDILNAPAVYTGLNWGVTRVRLVARGANAGSDERNLSINYTGFIGANQTIKIVGIDYTNEGISVLSSGSELIVNKLY